MRPRFIVDDRRTTPCTSYPFPSRSSARYEPSWPVIPVMSAVLAIAVEKSMVWALRGLLRDGPEVHTRLQRSVANPPASQVLGQESWVRSAADVEDPAATSAFRNRCVSASRPLPCKEAFRQPISPSSAACFDVQQPNNA